MAGIKIKIHPLFYPVLILSLIYKQFFLFLIYVITALLHEFGHLYVAEKNGYSGEKIILSGYGANLVLDDKGLKTVDQIKIALAGPFFNLIIALFFIAFWWILPDTYPFTESIVTASLSFALINLLPVYPLDGGRVLQSLLTLLIGDKSKKVVKILGIIFTVLLSALFILSLFNTPNYTLLIFTAFLVVDLIFTKNQSRLVKIKFMLSSGMLRGGFVKRIAVDSSVTVKRLISLLSTDNFNEVEVYKGESLIKRLNPFEVGCLIENSDIYFTLEKAIATLKNGEK
ncbi:MAG: site-2 protease family protein [Clostridia bacterium]|nr:site-2 protease family protein [Clostridia bacterium]